MTIWHTPFPLGWQHYLYGGLCVGAGVALLFLLTGRVGGMSVSAAVKLTHPVGVKLTHLGQDGSLLRAADVDSGEGGGNTSDGPSGSVDQADRT